MVFAEIDDDDVSLLIRATFTYMGRMAASGRVDEYRKAVALVKQMRASLHLAPMSESEMLIHSNHMWNAR